MSNEINTPGSVRLLVANGILFGQALMLEQRSSVNRGHAYNGLSINEAVA